MTPEDCLKRMRPLLGCFVEIGLPKTCSSELFNAAFAQIELIHHLLSFHSPDSDLTRLNRAKGQMVPCHPLSLACLRLAKAMTRASQGAFNCTLGGSLVRTGVLPKHDFDSDTIAALGTWQDIVISAQGACVRPGVILSLDGIAKGFAVDSAIKTLQRAGARSGWINAGGDVRAFGALVLPVSIRDHGGVLHPQGSLCEAALATSTSCASERFPGVLLDANGQPIPAQTLAVMAHTAWRADALTKVAAATAAAFRSRIVAALGGRCLALAS